METIVVVTFGTEAKAYQALSAMKALDRGEQISLWSAAVVERQGSGLPVVRDGADVLNVFGPEPTGLVGNLIEVLGKPNGNGAPATSTSLYFTIGERIPAGTTALIAETTEYATEVLDGAMTQLGGTVAREASIDVLADIQTAEDALTAAEKEAARQKREDIRRQREQAKVKRHNDFIDSLSAVFDRVERCLEGKKRPEPATATSTQ
jgi:uncharacterized membrane protein